MAGIISGYFVRKKLHQLRQQQKEEYKRRATFKPLPGSTVESLHLDAVFVELKLRKKTRIRHLCEKSKSTDALFLRLGEDDGDRSVDLSDMFKALGGSTPQTVAILGPAGSGKTTCLAKKLPYEWAMERVLGDAELVFLIVVRRHERDHGDVTQAKTLEDLFGLNGLDADVRDKVLSNLKTNEKAENVVVIVDGECLYSVTM